MGQSMSVYRQNNVDYVIDDPTVAPVFDESSAYSSGQFVKHEGKLYILPEGHEENTTWANTSKTQVILGNEIRDAKLSLFQNRDAVRDTVFKHEGTLSATWEKGTISAQGINIDADNRIRFVGMLKIKPDSTIYIIADEGYEFEIYLYDSTQTYKGHAEAHLEYGSVKYGSGISEAYYYRLVARRKDNANMSLGEKRHITFVSIPDKDYVSAIEGIENKMKLCAIEAYLVNLGYLQGDGTPHEQTYEYEKYTDPIPVNRGNYIIQYNVDLPTGKSPWMRVSYFDSNDEQVIYNTYNGLNQKENTVEIAVTDESIAYMVISVRTFNVDCFVGFSGRFINLLNDKIDERLTNFNKSNSTVFVSREGKFANTIENSADGIRAAKENGYDIIRVDVQFTSDGVPVLFHDAYIGASLNVYDENGNQITNGNKVSTYSYATLATYHYGSTTNELVTLDDCAALCKKYGLALVLEMKDATVPTQQNISDAYDIVAKNGMAPETEWDVYSATTAGYILAIDDTADIGYISEDITTGTIDAAAALNTGKNKVYFCAYATQISSFTDALHVYGLRHGVMFKMGSAYNVSEIYTFRKFEKIEVANVVYPAKEFAMYS